MKKLIFFTVVLFLLLLTSKQSRAVSERFNVGVGYGGINELVISTDSPGEFNYHLYLRTADNTQSDFTVHYTGVNNLYRTIRLSCVTDEVNALDNPVTGTCISGGPFVRGAFVAGNDGQFAIVKKFTLFCGSIQVTGEDTTNSWNSDFYNSAIKDHLDNGASSTWCPPASVPAPTSAVVSSKIPTITPKPVKKLTPTKQPGPTEKVATSSPVAETPTPTIIQAGGTEETPERNNALSLVLIIAGAVVLAVVGYFNRGVISTFLKPSGKKQEIPQIEQLPDSSTNLKAESEDK